MPAPQLTVGGRAQQRGLPLPLLGGGYPRVAPSGGEPTSCRPGFCALRSDTLKQFGAKHQTSPHLAVYIPPDAEPWSPPPKFFRSWAWSGSAALDFGPAVRLSPSARERLHSDVAGCARIQPCERAEFWRIQLPTFEVIHRRPLGRNGPLALWPVEAGGWCQQMQGSARESRTRLARWHFDNPRPNPTSVSFP